ncbi:MAG TPA: hypothetical protein VK528_11095 [Flavobacterium sp.]|nr:hypothetical protein [Flavobacterium sp.]
MKSNKRGIAAAVILLIAIGNYSRMPDSESIRAVAFLSIFAIGALSAVVIREILGRIREKQDE